MKIFDCFPFYNELELLELRFRELYNTVDHFVLSEANITHTGKKKPFYFEENKERYKDYLDKVILVKVEDAPIPDKDNAWVAENFQRNAIARGLDGVARKEDRVLVSDVDEIPNVDTVKKYLDYPGWISFKQSLFYYYVNVGVARNWGGTAMGRYGTFRKPQQLKRFSKRHAYGTVGNGGWHYSYLTGGDTTKIMKKIRSTVKGFFNSDVTEEMVKERVSKLSDLYKRRSKNYRIKVVDITNNKPKSMDWFLKKYPHFFYEGSL